jgi:hypothetical protein
MRQVMVDRETCETLLLLDVDVINSNKDINVKVPNLTNNCHNNKKKKVHYEGYQEKHTDYTYYDVDPGYFRSFFDVYKGDLYDEYVDDLTDDETVPNGSGRTSEPVPLRKNKMYSRAVQFRVCKRYDKQQLIDPSISHAKFIADYRDNYHSPSFKDSFVSEPHFNRIYPMYYYYLYVSLLLF